MPPPFEVLAGPADVWLAVLATADPAINAAPPAAWIKLGANGSKDMDESGVIVRPGQDVTEFFGLGATGPLKAFRGRESFEVEFTLHDATLESYSRAFNENAITTVVGPPAEKTILIKRGPIVQLKAMLIRLNAGNSPYADSANFVQWFLPSVYNRAVPETVYRKAEPVGLHFVFGVLEDAALGFGTLHAPTT